ncbi:AraC family transcriptional regulator [Pseudonocardia humida]|uniref:Helix-turn-helix domain-containing protein n=1 Tax=Pseudonocardia humida TaxID=2800819 RepID=A0ABT0ZVM5_9PSEU|nr:helix-turn-helix transcriptional regulator [Pseudonocardia humida]MCO1654795.1 helix-turn-helix domain-containing protein [Pseudonocardia humida]
MRQVTDDDLLARSFSVTMPGGTFALPTEPGWHQLVHASAGSVRVETGGALGPGRAEVRVLPPHRALWLPDGWRARIGVHRRVALRTLYLTEPPRLPARPLAVDVAPLLHELILQAVRDSPLLRDSPEHRRLLDVLGDRLVRAPTAPEVLPLPTDRRALALADALRADPAGTAPLRRLAEGTGAGHRTLERLFLAETGLTISRWRQRLRLLLATELLAAGEPVTAVATAVGYATPSAFTAMYRAHLGTTPSRTRSS